MTDTLTPSPREREIEMLSASIDKTESALRIARVQVLTLEDKLVAKRAELRLQRLLLARAQRIATRRELAATVGRMMT